MINTGTNYGLQYVNGEAPLTYAVPVLVRSPKLSNVDSGQYLDGCPVQAMNGSRRVSMNDSLYLAR